MHVLVVALDVDHIAHPVVGLAKDALVVMAVEMDVVEAVPGDVLAIATEVVLVGAEMPVLVLVMELVRKVVMGVLIVVAVIVQKVALDVLDAEVLALLVVLAVQDVAADVVDALILVLILVLQLAHQLVLTHVQAHVMVLLPQPVAN